MSARRAGRRPATWSPSRPGAFPPARCLGALQAIMAEGPWLAGAALSLADLHAAPMLACFRMAAEGQALLAEARRARRWWQAIARRPSLAATRSPLEG